MGNFVFNQGLGQAVAYYRRVDENDPANSALILMVLDASGVESDATLKDKDSFADILSGATNEVTNSGYARKTLTDADLVAFSPDDVNDRADLDFPDQTFTGVGAGTAWSDVDVGFDPDTTGGTDSAIIPISQHDFPVTPDGSDITIQVAAAGFFRAS